MYLWFFPEVVDLVFKMNELGIPLTDTVVTRAMLGRQHMNAQDLKTLALLLKESIFSGSLQVSVLSLEGVMDALIFSGEKLAAVQLWKHCFPLLRTSLTTILHAFLCLTFLFPPFSCPRAISATGFTTAPASS